MCDVSILIPCHNHAALLPEAVASVLAQHGLDKKFSAEVIIVDDGSVDDSADVADDLAEREPHVRALHQPRRGQALARQAALDVARGEFTVMLDADDLLEPGMLQAGLYVLRSAEVAGRVNIATANARLVAGDGERELSVLWNELRPWPDVLEYNSMGSLAACIVRTELIRQVGGMAAGDMDGCEDWDLWARLARLGERAVALPQIWARYRQHGDNFSARAEPMLEAEMRLLERAAQPDPRLPAARQLPPAPAGLLARCRNGRVFHAFGLGLGMEEEYLVLERMLAHITREGLEYSFCCKLAGWGLGYARLRGKDDTETPSDWSGGMEALVARSNQLLLKRLKAAGLGRWARAHFMAEWQSTLHDHELPAQPRRMEFVRRLFSL